MDQQPSAQVSFRKNLKQMGNVFVVTSQTMKIKTLKSQKLRSVKVKAYRVAGKDSYTYIIVNTKQCNVVTLL